MLVNCLDLKVKKPKEECWKAPNGKYYSNESAYLAMKTERRATARDTGEKKPISMLYKAPNGLYYSCEEAYQDMRETTELRNRCTAKMQEIMDYQSDMKLPTYWYKLLNEYAVYGFDVVYDTIVANEDSFTWALNNKNFKNDTLAIKYFNAIIQNHVHEQYRKKKATEKAKLQSKKEQERLQSNQLEIIDDIGRKSVKGHDVSGLFDFV